MPERLGPVGSQLRIATKKVLISNFIPHITFLLDYENLAVKLPKFY
jgi:hypothetical protein